MPKKKSPKNNKNKKQKKPDNNDTPKTTLSVVTMGIDHTAFPLIVVMIFNYATFDQWVVIRATSREYRDRMEKLMCRHVQLVKDSLKPEGPQKLMTPAPSHYKHPNKRKRIPCLSLKEPFKQRTLDLLRKYTHILDDDSHDESVHNPNAQLAILTVMPETFENLHTIRRSSSGGFRCEVAKAITQHGWPAWMTVDDRWGEHMNYLVRGLRHVPHQVNCFSYEFDSFVLPPWSNVEWDGVTDMVFIFEGRESFSDPDHVEFMEGMMEDPESDCGRSNVKTEMPRLLNVLGLGSKRKASLSKLVNITFVGLDELLRTGKSKQFKLATDTNEAIRSYLQTFATAQAVTKPKFAALLNQVLEQSEFISQEAYILRVGEEQYEFETNCTL